MHIGSEQAHWWWYQSISGEILTHFTKKEHFSILITDKIKTLFNKFLKFPIENLSNTKQKSSRQYYIHDGQWMIWNGFQWLKCPPSRCSRVQCTIGKKGVRGKGKIPSFFLYLPFLMFCLCFRYISKNDMSVKMSGRNPIYLTAS